MGDVLLDLDVRDPDAVIRALAEGTDANQSAACRRGSIDVITPPGTLIATGDIHDNPAHLQQCVRLAHLSDTDLPEPNTGPTHLTLHELIHGDNLYNGMDFSYRMLARVAALKAAFPERVHTLLANHELSQIVGAGIVKDGLNVVKAFNDGVEYVFGGEADRVHNAIAEFIRSMPLALRCEKGDGSPGLLCSHSLPAPDLMDRFDASVLERPLTDDDYVPRRGSAHLMVWGRKHTREQLEALAQRWNVGAFVLGHEHAPEGWLVIEYTALVLNTDHSKARIAHVDLNGVWSIDELRLATRALRIARAAD